MYGMYGMYICMYVLKQNLSLFGVVRPNLEQSEQSESNLFLTVCSACSRICLSEWISEEHAYFTCGVFVTGSNTLLDQWTDQLPS